MEIKNLKQFEQKIFVHFDGMLDRVYLEAIDPGCKGSGKIEISADPCDEFNVVQYHLIIDEGMIDTLMETLRKGKEALNEYWKKNSKGKE